MCCCALCVCHLLWACVDDAKKAWYEFNDHQVKPFNVARLNDETFGGSEDVEGVYCVRCEWYSLCVMNR